MKQKGLIFPVLLDRDAKVTRKKTIFRPAGIAFTQQKTPLKNILFALERAVMKKSSAVLFHSNGEMENAKNLFNIKLDNGHVILTGFDVDKFSIVGFDGVVSTSALDKISVSAGDVRDSYQVG